MIASGMCPLHQTTAAAPNGLHVCLVSLPSWMNKLKLNSDNTVPYGGQTTMEQISLFPIELLAVETNPTKSACNLGSHF